MAGSLTQRHSTAAKEARNKDMEVVAEVEKRQQQHTVRVETVESSSDEASTGSSSNEGNNVDRNNMDKKKINRITYNGDSKGKSLKERSQIPNSFYVILSTIVGLQYFSGMYNIKTIESYFESISTSAKQFVDMIYYTKQIIFGEISVIRNTEYVRVGMIVLLCLSLFYIFIIAPFKAGFWTGPRTTKHKVHRYMGLLYLTQYAIAWIEFCTNYNSNKSSYLCHFIAVNGIIQGISAFVSFKVLPELDDPGYYSDKAVLSRKFIHENLFFTLFSVFGSVYYMKDAREGLQTNMGGKIIEHIFIFWPYIVIRPFFPTTSFSSAGTTHKGRTTTNEKFYQIGTYMVKLFYLWAKYFFGFFINYSVYLNIVNEEDWKLIHGMLLLNAGTVSLSVFLHTLRFRKVLPAKFTFSVYLVQIYLSFLALPIACKMFMAHPNLCALCLSGLLLNMTRSRIIHAVWCLAAVILLNHMDIEW